MEYQQISMMDAEETAEYRAFVEKFKPKKTTDDCYTPEIVHEAVMAWVEKRYGIDRGHFVRPFWPGADFTRFDYQPDSVVVDNPPFSILKKITQWYQARKIRFFLYAPALTLFGSAKGATAVCASCSITYANGADVNTSFVTNMEGNTTAMSAPELHDAVEKAAVEYLRGKRVHVPKYKYPANVVTAAMMNYMAEHGESFSFRREDCAWISALDEQREKGKSVFGGGYLLAEKAAAEKAAAEKAAAEKAAAEKADAIEWVLSEREKEQVAELNKREAGG